MCTSENYEMDLVIDVNTQLYPIGVGQRFTFALARTLNEDGSADDDVYDQVSFVLFTVFRSLLYVFCNCLRIADKLYIFSCPSSRAGGTLSLTSSSMSCTDMCSAVTSTRTASCATSFFANCACTLSINRIIYNRSVIASFGGLLMKLQGDARNLLDIKLDFPIYILMRKA